MICNKINKYKDNRDYTTATTMNNMQERRLSYV